MISKAPETLTACKYFKDGGFDEYLTDIDMGTVVEVFDMGLSKGGYTGENKKGKDNLNFEREYESGKRRIILMSVLRDSEGGKCLTHEWEFSCPENEAKKWIGKFIGFYTDSDFEIV